MKLKVIVHEAEEGGYWAEVSGLVGCITEGDTMKELRKNVREAARGWLEVVQGEPKSSRRARVIEVNI